MGQPKAVYVSWFLQRQRGLFGAVTTVLLIACQLFPRLQKTMSYAVLGESNDGKLRSVPSASEDDNDLLQRGSSSSKQSSSLSEPLTANGNSASEDPFYVFREDLYRKLEQVDEGLADYLRIVHQTVSRATGKGGRTWSSLFLFVSCRLTTIQHLHLFSRSLVLSTGHLGQYTRMERSQENVKTIHEKCRIHTERRTNDCPSH